VRYLSLAEVLLLHHLVMKQSRQDALLRDLGGLGRQSRSRDKPSAARTSTLGWQTKPLHSVFS
jgi:hypothetical protein